MAIWAFGGAERFVCGLKKVVEFFCDTTKLAVHKVGGDIVGIADLSAIHFAKLPYWCRCCKDPNRCAYGDFIIF